METRKPCSAFTGVPIRSHGQVWKVMENKKICSRTLKNFKTLNRPQLFPITVMLTAGHNTFQKILLSAKYSEYRRMTFKNTLPMVAMERDTKIKHFPGLTFELFMQSFTIIHIIRSFIVNLNNSLLFKSHAIHG